MPPSNAKSTDAFSSPSSGDACFDALCLVVMLLAGSLRAVFKYLPSPGLLGPLMLGGGYAIYALLLTRLPREQFQRAGLGKPRLLCAAFSLAIVAAAFFIYPLADARRAKGEGSTADDALVEASHSFLAGDGMYSKRVLDQVPISAGPGWVILNLPLENERLVWAISPLYILICLVVASHLLGSARPAAVVLCLVSSSLLFWELLVTAHDIVALGFVFALLILVAWWLAQEPLKPFRSIVFGILVGMVATSRVVFAALPLLLALMVWKSNRRLSLLIGGVGMLVVVFFHAYFYCTSDFYQPLHLLGRGRQNVGPALMFFGLLAEVLAVAYAYWQLTSRPATWLLGGWLCLVLPLSLISLGELETVGWEFAMWEGANYIFPCVPCYLFYIAVKNTMGELPPVGVNG